MKCTQCQSGLLAFAGACVYECPAGFKQSGSFCVCSNSSLILINNQCLLLQGCPIKMSFDLASKSCLSCPFGCMSCSSTVCTSCSPGYFLYVSPQGIRCRRKSPLFPCDKQYSLVQGVCLVIDYANLNMNLCVGNVKNCKVCQISTTDLCVLCEDKYLLYNGSCILACPTGMIQYENTCILTEIANCSLPHL
jgi:hypothetical protein